jgi:hypothetical protein
MRERLSSLAASQIDWNYLLLIAQRHAVLPLVYYHLGRHPLRLIPAEIYAKLRDAYQQNAARNAVLTAELCRLVELLRSSGIEAIPFKGPSLAAFAYGDISLRSFVDLDVIIKKSQLTAAREILTNDGYEVSKPLSVMQQEVLEQTQHNIQLRGHNGKLILELHWDVAPALFSSPVQSLHLWSRLSQQLLNNTSVNALCAEDLLLSLCIHGSRHLWERLAWICDVAELISRHEFEWTSLRKTLDADSERMLLLGLYLADGLLGARIPAGLIRDCEADMTIVKLAERIVEHLFDGPRHVPATFATVFRYNFKLRRTWRARVRYFGYMISPSDRDVVMRDLPRGLTFAYYFARPFRLLLKTARDRRAS